MVVGQKWLMLLGTYAKAGVYDPATLLGFGLGKLFGFGATKTSAQAANKLMKQAYLKQQ